MLFGRRATRGALVELTRFGPAWSTARSGALSRSWANQKTNGGLEVGSSSSTSLVSSHSQVGIRHIRGSGGGAVALAGILFLPTLLMIVFRLKHPRWWYDWNLQLLRFSNRVAVYLALMDDRYPSTDEQQSVHLDFPYPDVERDLNRWLPLVKWFLAVPHYIVLFVLWIAAFVCVVIAWFAILFTGRYPEGLFRFVEGVLRWGNRVTAYAFVLITDRYPPFSLS